MKRLFFCFGVFSFLLIAGNLKVNAQCNDCKNGSKRISHKRVNIKQVKPDTSNVHGKLTQNYLLQNICGLNYTQVSVLTETRTRADTFNVNGSGFPTVLNLTGLPYKTCPSILKAYLYFGCTYSEQSAPAATVTITNPAYTITTLPATIAGTTQDMICWGGFGSANYRVDVTSLITGNGNYTVKVSGFMAPAWEIDGATLLVLYSDPSASYSGSIALWDGELSTDDNVSITSVDKSFSVCAATPNATAFSILADVQARYGTDSLNVHRINAERYNGNLDTFSNLFWNFCEVPTSLYASQDSIVYNSYVNDSGDCYFIGLQGLYWQNTNCVTCSPTVSTLTITPTATVVTCGNNGSASVVVSGATGPLTYYWSPSGQTTDTATMLKQGTYTITVSDGNSCAGDTITVGNIGMVLNMSTVPQYCTTPGTATINASGGWPPYTYLWSNSTTTSSITVTAGFYSVAVSDNSGCTLTDTVTLFYTTPIIAYVMGNLPITCPPTPGWLNITTIYGGHPPYTYSWSPGGQTTTYISGLSAGMYTINITDSIGCTFSATDSLYNYPTLMWVTINTTPYYCSALGGSANAVVHSGTPPYTYLWSPGGQTTDTINGLSAGTYSVTVTDSNGCIYSWKDSIVTGTVSDTIYNTFNSINAGDSTDANGWSNVPATYSWSPAVLATYPDSSYTWLHPASTTIFTLTITTACGTYTDTLTVFVSGCANTHNESICIVTIDTNTDRDEIIWQRVNSPSNGYYFIYKETSSSSYSMIASQPVTVMSDYIDTASRPNLAPCSYELQTYDSCGFSLISAQHTSIYMTDTAMYHVNVINWTPYVGFTPAKYFIYRGLSLHTLVKIDSVPVTALTYHDTLPPPSAVYMVQAENPGGPCIPTTKIKPRVSSNGVTLVSRSNTRRLKNYTGIEQLDGVLGNVNIFPNPNTGTFNLSYSLTNSGNVSLSIIDELGQVVFTNAEHRSAGQTNEQINLENLAAGIYSLRLQTSSGITVKKLVVMKR